MASEERTNVSRELSAAIPCFCAYWKYFESMLTMRHLSRMTVHRVGNLEGGLWNQVPTGADDTNSCTIILRILLKSFIGQVPCTANRSLSADSGSEIESNDRKVKVAPQVWRGFDTNVKGSKRIPTSEQIVSGKTILDRLTQISKLQDDIDIMHRPIGLSM